MKVRYTESAAREFDESVNYLCEHASAVVADLPTASKRLSMSCLRILIQRRTLKSLVCDENTSGVFAT
jgi:hypothetical protein